MVHCEFPQAVEVVGKDLVVGVPERQVTAMSLET